MKPDNPLVRLAKAAVEAYIKDGTCVPVPDELSPDMAEKAGVFVCIKKDGELRGCIGTFMATTGCVAEEIIRNSVSAATEDPRFSKVEGAELDNLDYTIDVLSPPEPVKNLKELDHKKYGVIVVSGHRRGLLLPDLEGVDSVEHQVIIAKQKAGIGMSEPVQLFRFEVRRHT